MTRSTRISIAALTLAAGAASAQNYWGTGIHSGDWLLPQDVTWGGGTLTVNPGAKFRFPDETYSFTMLSGSTLIVNGTPENPVVFTSEQESNGWLGQIVFEPGSTIIINHAEFRDAVDTVLQIDGADVTLNHCTFQPSLSYRYPVGIDFPVIEAISGASLVMDGCTIKDFTGRDGSEGSSSATPGANGFTGERGYDIIGVRVTDGVKAHIINSTFINLTGGTGGKGGQGRKGAAGADGDNGGLIDDNAHDGEKGGEGGDGGSGGLGGDVLAIRLNRVSNVLIAQNVAHNLSGGQGGNGGNAGSGGDGGDGGDGVDGVLWDGGNAGDGGDGGNGGRGGHGRESGLARFVEISNPIDEHKIINNTVSDLTTLPGGNAGNRGNRGIGGSKGSPGSAGTWGDPGLAGSNGSYGSYGAYGSNGPAGEGLVFSIGNSPLSPGRTATINNNVVTLTGPGSNTFILAGSSSIVDARFNASDPMTTWTIGSYVTGSPLPGIVELGTGFAPAQFANALVDAGNNAALPVGMDFDYNGNFRLMNDPLIPNTGVGSFPGDELVVDIGAVELDGWTTPCEIDINGDGVVDNADIGDFVNLYLSGDPAADFTGDGLLDNGDIGAFVADFLAGC